MSSHLSFTQWFWQDGAISCNLLAHYMHLPLPFCGWYDTVKLSFPVQSWLEWSQLAHLVLRAKWFCMLLQFLCWSVSVFAWVWRHCCSVAGCLSRLGLHMTIWLKLPLSILFWVHCVVNRSLPWPTWTGHGWTWCISPSCILCVRWS